MALSIPGNSSDLYGYISRGAQQTLFHQNPYFETVNLIPDYNKNPLFINIDFCRNAYYNFKLQNLS